MQFETGNLGNFYDGLAWKFLTKIDLPNRGSNQHELQGISKLRQLLGDRSHSRFRVLWRMLNVDDEGVEESVHDMTWYDARRNNPNRSPEWRFYYESGTPLEDAEIGDLLLGTKVRGGLKTRSDIDVVFYVVSQRSTLFQKLLWLLRITPDSAPKGLGLPELQKRPVQYIAQEVLEQLDPELSGALLSSGDALESKIRTSFASFLSDADYYNFPPTQSFADFAQANIDVDVASKPDRAIERLLELETAAFHILEKEAVEKVLEEQRKSMVDVDTFISFSLSVQNRRKSRRGRSLENHLAYVFTKCGLEFEAQAVTENKSTVDFLFPSTNRYHELSAPIENGVVALGAKTTLKERWRQVLAEASKMKHRHLFTLEAGISATQTAEMGENSLSLVAPESARDSYPDPGTEILTLREFCDYVSATV